MRVISAVLAVVASVVIPSVASAQDWAPVAATVKQSIVEIAIGGQGACTGFVIDNNRDYVLTAAHCDVENQTDKLYVDTLVAEVKAKDVKRDLMVLYVKDIDRPALKLAKDDPKIGDAVASYGYGYALEEPLFRTAHISANDIAIEQARYVVIDSSFVGGQSGGPVVNVAGEVVMVVQLGNPYVGMGVSAEIIRDKVGRFFTLEGAKQ